MPADESVIRDALAQRLDLLEPGLKLVDIERFLPATRGARGFVDIVARDAAGNIVLIELKRSSASSREALQELLKYLDLIVAHQGISRWQLRCLVVSTTWHELEAPFAELTRVGDFQFDGYLLVIDADGVPLSAQLVVPEPPRELEFCSTYLIHCYEREEQRDAVALAIRSFLAGSGSVDFILVHQQYGNGDPHIVYPFSLTIALARRRALPLPIAPGRSGAARQDAEDDDPEDPWASEQALLDEAVASAPWFPRDIGVVSSFRFVARLNDGWKATHWIAGGPTLGIASDLRKDDDLLRLVAGFDTYNGIYLCFASNPNTGANWSHRIRQIERLLGPDPALRELVVAVLAEFADREPRGRVGFVAFYPEDLILAVCGEVLLRENRLDPELTIALSPPDDSRSPRAIRCFLCWDGETQPVDALALVHAIYDGDIHFYHLSSTMHGHFARRAELLSALGLRWRIFENGPNNTDAHELTIDEGKLTRTRMMRNSIPILRSYVEHNWKFVCDLATVVTSGTFNSPFEPAPIVTRPGEPEYLQDAPERCALCARTFGEYMYDVAVPPRNRWACICRFCFNFHRCSIGSGNGQLYALSADDRWLLVDGDVDLFEQE